MTNHRNLSKLFTIVYNKYKIRDEYYAATSLLEIYYYFFFLQIVKAFFKNGRAKHTILKNLKGPVVEILLCVGQNC